MADMFKAFLTQVRRVPRGKVVTYGDVAYAAGFPGAARQVAWALHSSRELPWHRVVGAGGRILLGGEAGFEQRMRLQGEGVAFRGLRVAMEDHQFSFFADNSGKRKAAGRKLANKKKRAKASPARRKAL
jgi:methylated-DNA-protein-cysteine methyltransferase-like protein